MHPDSTSGIFRYSEPGFTPDPQEHRLAITATPEGAGGLVVSPSSQKVIYGLWVPQASQTNDDLGALALLCRTLVADQLTSIPVTAILSGHKIILVPGLGFSAEDTHHFYSMAFMAGQSAEILTQEVIPLNATAIYTEEKYVVDLVRKHLPGVGFSHGAIDMMQKGHSLITENNPIACTLFLTGNKMFVQVYHNDKLLFFNSFTYQTTEELVYYIAAIARNLELDPQTLRIQLTGVEQNLHQYNTLLTPFFPLTETVSIHPSLPSDLSELGHRLHLLATHLL